jgi:hypothetical protein
MSGFGGVSRATWIAEKKRDEMKIRRPDSGMLKEKLRGTDGRGEEGEAPGKGVM